MLELKSAYVSTEKIDKAFQLMQDKYNPKDNPDADQAHYKRIIAAHRCLKRTRCRDQYTRYNLSIDLPDDPNVEIDWRMGFTICFYVLYAFISATLASVEMKPGIRLSMGLGIMFCIDEILIGQDISALIKDGMQSNPNIQQLLSFFPKNYATFEVVILIRIFYFLCFNIISSASLVYVVDEAKARSAKALEMRKNQVKLTELTNNICEAAKGKKMLIAYEMRKKEYMTFKRESVKELDENVKQLKTGKTKEQVATGENRK